MNLKDITLMQWVKPKKLWNKSTGDKRMHLDDEVQVIALRNCQSQTGVMFLVGTKAAGDIWLDSNWFEDAA